MQNWVLDVKKLQCHLPVNKNKNNNVLFPSKNEYILISDSYKNFTFN